MPLLLLLAGALASAFSAAPHAPRPVPRPVPQPVPRPDPRCPREAALGAEWVPIELFRGRWAFVPARLAGRPTEVLLDSGAGMSVLALSEARRRGIDGMQRVMAAGIGGRQEAWIHPGLRLEVGALKLELPVAILDLEAVEELMGHELSFVLGREVFRELVVDLDYPRRRVAFHRPGGFRYEGAGRALSLADAPGGTWAVELEIEDEPAGLFQLDTGSGDPLLLHPEFVRRHELLEGRRTSLHLATGIGGSRPLATGTLERVRLGPWTLREVPAGFLLAGEAPFGGEGLAGTLGAGLLERFRLTVDPRRRRLWLEVGEDLGAPFQRDRSGLQTRRSEDALVTVHVAPGSPAARAGWRPGERIVAVDGTAVAEGDLELLFAWRFRPAGTRVVLTDAEGRERALVLEDYF